MNIEFNKNEDNMKLLVSELRQKINKIKLGGGKKKLTNCMGKEK